ncbi:MAG: hypothetical protein IPJ19_14325 [Planctomycetes bacterium]|nr:hypothetical protein [Planctomycetota bacterium]
MRAAPQQWSKNVFVLAAFVFARGEHGGNLIAWGDDARRTLFALIGFCLGASAIYLVNDVLDVESDRKAPRSAAARSQPASSIALALGTALALLAAAVALGLAAGGEPLAVAWVLGAPRAQPALQPAPEAVVLVDAFCIAAGFLLRVKAGALAAGAPVSHWLMLCTLFLALFPRARQAPRRERAPGRGRGGHRAILLEYDTRFLDQMLGVLAACAIVTYDVHGLTRTVAKFARGAELVYTVPFVVFGLALPAAGAYAEGRRESHAHVPGRRPALRPQHAGLDGDRAGASRSATERGLDLRFSRGGGAVDPFPTTETRMTDHPQLSSRMSWLGTETNQIVNRGQGARGAEQAHRAPAHRRARLPHARSIVEAGRKALADATTATRRPRASCPGANRSRSTCSASTAGQRSTPTTS